MTVASLRKKESSVWEYFQYDAVANKSVCLTKVADKQCDKLIASSNSINLIAHLKACHKAEFGEFTENEKARKLTMNTKQQPAVNVQTQSHQITTFLRQSSVWLEGSTEVKLRNDALVNLIAGAGLSVRIVNDASFKEFCQTFDPKYRIPGTYIVKY